MQKELEKRKEIVGYHTLKLLDGLRLSYRDAEKEIEKVKKLNRLWDYQRNERLSKLREYQNSLKAEFEYWSELVENWVSKFPEKDELYGDVIIEYYCNFYSIESLKDVIAEILCEENDRNKESQNFQAKIRQITLNEIQK